MPNIDLLVYVWPQGWGLIRESWSIPFEHVLLETQVGKREIPQVVLVLVLCRLILFTY